MFTLLPPEEKKILAVEYKRRLFAVVLVAFCVAIVIAGILFLPSYLLTKIQLKEYNAKEEAMKNSSQVTEEGSLLKSLKNTSDELTIAKISEHFPSQVFQKIQTYQPAGIQLSHFSYSYGSVESTLTLSGVAASRQTLINFNDALKKDPLFVSSDFPLSNLSSSKDISFTMNIKGKF